MAQSSARPPPLDGSCLITEALDFNFHHNANQPFYVYAGDHKPETIVSISHLEFGRACHRVAHSFRPKRAGPDSQVVAIIGLVDTLLYHALTVGLITAGFIPFPMSPRNSPAAVVELLRNTSCHRVITTQSTLRPLIDGIHSHLTTVDPQYVLSVEEVPLLMEIYPRLGTEMTMDPFRPFPLGAERPQPKDRCLYLHSSGSTGFPKAIPLTHLTLLQWASLPGVTDFRDANPRVRVACMPLPPFHTLGIYTQMLTPIFGTVPIALYPPMALSISQLPMVPSPDNILEHTRRTRSNAMAIIPALLQVWSQSQDAIEILKGLSFIMYSGGSLAPKLGDYLISQGVPIHSIYGGTEFGAPTWLKPKKEDAKDWAWMEFDEERVSVRWVPQGDGTFECQFLTTATHSPLVENIPDVRGYATSDLWERHSSKPHLWKLVGRIDDVIIHPSGEKTVPAPMEDIIMSSPLIQGAVIFGKGHDLVGVLIEPKVHQDYEQDSNQVTKFVNEIWHVLQEANKIAPAFSRIFKEMVIITSASKPLPRAGKGTVMRKAALLSYGDEIRNLYDVVESSQGGLTTLPPKSWEEADLQAWISDQVDDIHPGKSFAASVDLFEQGFDSLSATFLRQRFLGALRSIEGGDIYMLADNLGNNIVYAYPTIVQLAVYIATLVANPADVQSSEDGKLNIERMIEKYTSGLPTVSAVPASPSSLPTVVLLTGSTGSLGSYVLSLLLGDEKVQKVYAMNRPSSQSMATRHLTSFRERGLDERLLESPKLVYVEGDASLVRLGLDSALYEELRLLLTVIIHNAWKLDFNLGLGSFESHVRGTRHLIDLAATGPHASEIRFVFTSSVTSAQGWDRDRGAVPEEIEEDTGIAVGAGYGESKYVAERILASSGLQVTCLRIGQISGGSPMGAWSTTDWFPILVKSSLSLGAFPTADGIISWIPVDTVAKAIMGIVSSSKTTPMVMNLTHPRPIAWKQVVSLVATALLKQGIIEQALPLIPFHEWVYLLEKFAVNSTAEDLVATPAIKLLDFFRTLATSDVTPQSESGGLPTFSTEKAQTISRTLHDLRSLSGEDAELWVNYWQSAKWFI